MVKAVVDAAREGASVVRRPWLGARIQSVTPDIADSMGLDHPTGVLVASLQPKSPADEAGLKRGDLILTIDGQEGRRPGGVRLPLRAQGRPGPDPFGILRGTARQTVTVKLAPAPETRPRDVLKVRTRSPFQGATLVNTSPAVAEELQVDFPPRAWPCRPWTRTPSRAGSAFRRATSSWRSTACRWRPPMDLDRVTRNTLNSWEVVINRNGEIMTRCSGAEPDGARPLMAWARPGSRLRPPPARC